MRHDGNDPEPGRTLIASDFDLDAEPVVAPRPPEPETATAEAEAPRVVIEYRRRGLPWPLALPLAAILVLAAIAAYHHVMRLASLHARPQVVTAAPPAVDPPADPPKAPPAVEPLSLSSHKMIPSEVPPVPIAPGEFVGPPHLITAAAEVKPETKTETKAASEPLVAKELPAANWPPRPGPLSASVFARRFRRPPTTFDLAMQFTTPVAPPKPGIVAAPSDETPAPDPLPTSLEKPAETKPEQTADAPPVAPAGEAKEPEPDKLPSKEEVMAEIRREAEAKKAERTELKQFKEEAPELARKAKAAEVREERVRFLADLRNLIKTKKNDAGEEIERLHQNFIHDVDPEQRNQIQRMIRRASGRMSLQGKVKALRAMDVPEPVVLDVICNEVHARAHSTRCRCFAPQMYVLAARELLAVDVVTKARPAADKGDSPDRDPQASRTPARPTSTSGNRTAPRTQ